MVNFSEFEELKKRVSRIENFLSKYRLNRKYIKSVRTISDRVAFAMEPHKLYSTSEIVRYLSVISGLGKSFE